MFAPPGVDSSSSGEELTPPPSPVPQKVRPKFSFRSLFSPAPATPGGSDTHRRGRSRSLLRGERNKPTNEEVKHSTPVEAAEADPTLDTDNSLTPKKRVRIYAGELQTGEKARGLTNNLGEGVRDSLTLPSVVNHEPMIQPEAEGTAGISEEVFMMLKRYTDEQKELEHAEREQQREEASPPSPLDTLTPPNEMSSPRPPTPPRRSRPRPKTKPKAILTDTTLDDYPDLPTSSTLEPKRPTEQSKPTDILLRLKSSASSLSKKRSLKSLRSIKLNKKSLASHEIPPVPPIPKDNDGEGIMISRTPIADRFARPRNLLADQPQANEPQTAPPGINEFSQSTAQLQGTAQQYSHDHPESPSHCPHCHSPHTAPPMPFYPGPSSEAQRWCQPPGWPIHPYYPASPPLYPQPQNTNIPVSYVPAHQPQTITSTEPQPTAGIAQEAHTSPSEGLKVEARGTQPVLRSGPMREVKKHKAETFDSVEGEIWRSSQIESGGESKRSTEDEKQDRKEDVKAVRAMGNLSGSKDSQGNMKEETREASPPQKYEDAKPIDKSKEDPVVPTPGDKPDPTDTAKEKEKNRLEILVRQYKAKYAEAVKVYKNPGLTEGEGEHAKERVKRAEGKLREATQALKEYETFTKSTKGEKKDDRAIKDQQVQERAHYKDNRALEEEKRAEPELSAPEGRDGVVNEPATEEVSPRDSTPLHSSTGPTPGDQQEKAQLESTIKKYQSRLAQYRRAYSKEGISSEQKNDLKERIKADQAKLDQAIKGLKEPQLSASQAEAPQKDRAIVKDTEESLSRKLESPVQERLTVENQTQVKRDEKTDTQATSRQTPEIEELQKAVEKCQARYKHAIKTYKADGLSEDKRKTARDEVKTAEGRLKEIMQALQKAKQDPKGKGKTAGNDDTTVPPAELNVGDQNSEVRNERSKTEEQKDTHGQGSTETETETQRKGAERASSSSYRPGQNKVESGGAGQKLELELLVKKYQLRHKEAVKAYKAEGLTEDQRAKARDEVRRAEGKLKEATQALKDVQNPSTAPTDGKSNTVQEEALGLGQNDTGKSADGVAKSDSPEIKRNPKAEEETQETSVNIHKKRKELEGLVKKYQIRHKEAVQAYKQQPDLSEEKKAELNEDIKRTEEKLKEAVQSLEALGRDKKSGLNERAGKVDGEEEKESTKKDIEEQKQESATGQAGDNGIKELREIVEKYRLRYQEAVKVYKQDDLSDKKKEEARLNVKRAEAKLKEAVQALESANAKATGKVEEKAVSNEAKDEGLTDKTKRETPEGHKHAKGDHAGTLSAEEASADARDKRIREMEKTIEKYQARHKDAVKRYKSEGLSDQEKKEAEKLVQDTQVKLKEAMKALEDLKSKKGNAQPPAVQKEVAKEANAAEGSKSADMKESTKDDEVSGDENDTNQKKGKESEPAEKAVDEKPSESADRPKKPKQDTSNTSEQNRQIQEEAVQRYKQQYHEAVKTFKSPDLSEDQRDTAKDAVRRTEMKLKEAMQAFEDHKATSSAPKSEDTTRDERAKDRSLKSKKSADHASNAKEGKKEELKAQIGKYQSQYHEAIKAYKNPSLGEEDKRKAKEQVKRVEEKLEQARATLEALVKKSRIPESSDKQPPQEDRPQTEVNDRTKEVVDSRVQTVEAELKKLKSQYAEIMKVYKTKELGVEDKKKTKEKMIYLEQKIKRAQQELFKMSKTEIPTTQETSHDTTNGTEKDVRKLDEIHANATATWDQALKEYVTTPDMTEEEREKAREKVRVAKEEYDVAQAELRVAQKAEQSGVEQVKREEDAVGVSGPKDKEAKSVTHSPRPEPTQEPRLVGDTDRQQSHVPDNDEERGKKTKAYKAEYSQLAHRLKSGNITTSDRDKYTKKLDSLKAKLKELTAPPASEIAPSTRDDGTIPRKVADKGTLVTQAKQKYAALKKGAQEEGISCDERKKREATVLRQREIVNGLEKELHEQNASKGNEQGVTPDEVRGAILQAAHECGEKAHGVESRATEAGEGDGLSNSGKREVPVFSDSHEAWPPLRLSRKSSPAPPTPPKSPARAAIKKIPSVQPEAGEITWSKTLISLASCIDLANRILKSLDKSPSPSPITEIIQHLIVGLVMQKDVLLSLKEMVGENSASMIDEFGEHVGVIRSYVEDLIVRRKEGKMNHDGVVEVEKAVEKGSQVLENVTIQSIVNHIVEFTEYLTPGMIATLKEVAIEWKKEGLGVKVIIHTVLAIRKELAAIRKSKEPSKQIEEKKRTEGLIGTLDKVLALFSSDHQAEVSEAKAELKTNRLSPPAPPDDTLNSDMTNIGTMVRKEVKRDKGKRREDHVDVRHEDVKSPNSTIKPENIPIPSTPTPTTSKLYPISSTSSPMPRSHTPIEEPPSSLSHLMSKITHKLHPSSSKLRHGETERESSKKSKPKPEPIIAPSPHDGKVNDLKLPQTTQNFLSGGSSWKKRPRLRSSSTSSSFSATTPYTAPLPHPPSDGDSSLSTPYTGRSGMDQSSPSRYSQTSVETSTTASDNVAGELLAQADSGPQPVKHDWRDDLDPTRRSEKHEADEEQVKRAEDVLYNRVVAVPDTTRHRRKRGDYI